MGIFEDYISLILIRMSARNIEEIVASTMARKRRNIYLGRKEEKGSVNGIDILTMSTKTIGL